MSISTEKIKFATERFLLVRINPARYILPTLSAGLYQITLPFIINTLQRNGAPLTKDTTDPTVNDHWYQDENTKILKVKLASAPNATTNVLVAFYYLFYTAVVYRSISENPEDDSTPTRDWQPLMQNYPSVLQSFDNIYNGVFSINDTSIELINADGIFQTYLTDDDTFYNKTVDIWLCIEDVTNIQKIFTGTIKNLSISTNIVTVNVVDSFNKLKDIASMGDDTDEIYFTLDGFPDVDPKYASFPVPYIVGKNSRYITAVQSDPIPGNPVIYRISEANEAVCTSIFSPLSQVVNRQWGCCRQKGAVPTQSFGSVAAILQPATGFYYVRFSSLSNVYLGDTVKFNNGGGDIYGTVASVGNFTYLTVNYNCIVYDPSNSLLLTSTISNSKSFAVVIYDPTTATFFYPAIGRDYAVDDSVFTQGGNRYVKILFANNFEGLTISPALDPNKHKVYYRTSNSEIQSHADIIQDICDLVGIPTNAASFVAAYAALSVNARFQIPNFDESDYQPYLKYVQDVLSSTLGFLRINSSFETEYKLISAPSSTNLRDSSLMIADASGCTIEYQDIATKIIAYNPHNSSAFETSMTATPSETRDAPKARWLSGVENVNRFRHVLETITARIDAHIGLKSFRFAKYMFQTATEDIDTELGDDVELQNKIVAGGSFIQDVKIITIEKSPKYVSLEASDFKGL